MGQVKNALVSFAFKQAYVSGGWHSPSFGRNIDLLCPISGLRTIKHSTIKLYLKAVRNLHIPCGHGDPLSGELLLTKILQGILRYQGQSPILRQPVTPGILQTIKPILYSWLADRDFAIVWTAFTPAFFAFLRCSEFTYQGISRFRPQVDLSTDCASFHPSLASPQRMSLFVKASKTDAFRQGHIRLLIHAPPHRFAR